MDVDMDLRVEGVAQDAILQDEGNMQEINRVKSWTKQDFYSHYFGDGQRGADWGEENFRNYSMSFMLEIRIWGYDYL